MRVIQPGAAPELAQRHPGLELEQLDDVTEVDQQARRLAWAVAEGLRAQPLPPRLLDQLRVGALGLLAVARHAWMLRRRVSGLGL